MGNSKIHERYLLYVILTKTRGGTTGGGEGQVMCHVGHFLNFHSWISRAYFSEFLKLPTPGISFGLLAFFQG